MAYDALTSEQKAAIQQAMQIIRPSVGQMRKLVAAWKDVGIAYAQAGGPLRQGLNALASADVIPNESGLALAMPVTKAELTNPTGGILADMAAMVTMWEEVSRMALCVKLAGLNAQ